MRLIRDMVFCRIRDGKKRVVKSKMKTMMKRFIIGAMLILGLCSWVKAQKIDVRIRVVDEWNRPLQG